MLILSLHIVVHIKDKDSDNLLPIGETEKIIIRDDLESARTSMNHEIDKLKSINKHIDNLDIHAWLIDPNGNTVASHADE